MMTFHINDDRDYSEVIEKWVRDFVWTMNEDVFDGSNEF